MISKIMENILEDLGEVCLIVEASNKCIDFTITLSKKERSWSSVLDPQLVWKTKVIL